MNNKQLYKLYGHEIKKLNQHLNSIKHEDHKQWIPNKPTKTDTPKPSSKKKQREQALKEQQTASATNKPEYHDDKLPPKGHPNLYLSLLRTSEEYREQIENEIEELLASQTGYNDPKPKLDTDKPIQVFENLRKLADRTKEIGETENETIDRKLGITRRSEQ